MNGLRQYYRPPWAPALVWDLAPRPLRKTQMDDREVEEFEAPDGVEARTASDRDTALSGRMRSPITRFFSILGPGLVTGSADDDPSGIATYSPAGATYSNGLLWTVTLTLPLMLAVQEICDRMALVTGESLGFLARRKFSRRSRTVVGVLVVALIAANCLNLAADLMAIGQGMQMFHAGPAPMWSALAGLGIVVALVAGSFKIVAKIFKWLCLFLLVYVAVLGTTISPYMFFWQSDMSQDIGDSSASTHW